MSTYFGFDRIAREHNERNERERRELYYQRQTYPRGTLRAGPLQSEEHGRTAYEAYALTAVTRNPLPDWDNLTDTIRNHWRRS